MDWRAWLFVCLLALATAGGVDARERNPERPVLGELSVSQLPAEARATLLMIQRGPPFPFAKDGTIFANREGRLPRQRRGYYTEYTVRTPGSRDRGARRIVAGGDPQQSGEYYYSDDHYQTFKRIRG